MPSAICHLPSPAAIPRSEIPAREIPAQLAKLAAANSDRTKDPSQQQLAQLAPAAKSPDETPEAALAWLESIDRKRVLHRRGSQHFAREWLTLCTADPAYVLHDLRAHLARAEARFPVGDPIAFLAVKARAEAKFTPDPKRIRL